MLGFLKEINCCQLALFLALANIIEVLYYLHYSMQLDMNIGSYQARIELKINDLQKEIARLGSQNKMAEMVMSLHSNNKHDNHNPCSCQFAKSEN
ncbi:hypothetical protein RhiirA5_425755 [Rhizophagus irregularis]|uniref:Uncharacterized protein n=2 Tax=Rhizophagus irregularis TaxID=588596 RepID=U9TGS2_RHIID|nr:hypothetical protein GLOIN_2v1765754 [Rhizophagus irregularis DAOM 181602=DAOM 197198]PKC02081.1 hypothetical protein RhiirA5_425755 [Rhizophagus irregularis]PKC58320.1 hypothetical protein RhiirA1_471145 [Rhizophagus irregularis]PKY30503.1 hypothetical protein RhiirB3_447622 [Rhizophagus irregularis]POG79230.1 hypothetical protein GLOIN_2v1765754 [Rhizophagus irregularis DAOM 181602=DAOM 197198]UZO19760.1 hypothetical protein OCT59_011032 [Rhizophagus irregularis]|eukprot:XP_025186096.1 hypothetical protein GLOIN_2v1765754 [Rhizophagus irregularis DAOM 181602=DAOM 197198]